MEDSLRIWLNATCLDVFDDGGNDTAANASDAEIAQIVRLGQFIFSLSETNDLAVVIEEMSVYIGRDIGMELRNSNVFLIEACLICAVGSMSVDRARFVQSIMRMDTIVQQHIMQAIKNNLETYFPAESSDNEEQEEGDGDLDTIASTRNEDTTMMEEKEQVHEPVISDSKHIELPETTLKVCSDTSCSHCDENTKALVRAMENLDTVINREKENEIKLRSEITAQTNKLIDAEIAMIEKDEQLSEKVALLEETNARLHECQERIQKNQLALNTLQHVQDEVDVLRPKAERADQAEQQLEKARSRLDDLKGVRQQLKEESDAHAETHNQLLLAEQELDSLRRMKTQVEEYRNQCAESAIQIDEYALRLRQRDDTIRRLEHDLSYARGDHEGQREQAELLSAELRHAEEQLREQTVKGVGGIGEAMCELNPALMQELSKLRQENIELLRKIDASSLESLDALEAQIADQKCINSSLQEKWMHTKVSTLFLITVVTH